MHTDSAPLTPPIARPSLREAFWVWLKIGLLSFGGPAGQIALMHRELVERRRWISEGRFLHALNYCMVLPGPEAQQLATYIGWLLHGARGGLIAGTLFVLPGFIVIVLLSALYALLQDATLVASLFFGLKAAVLAIVVDAVIRVARRSLRNNVMRGVAAAGFIALFAFNVPFPLVIFSAGLLGYLGARRAPDVFAASPGHGAAHGDGGPAVIDENMPSIEPTWRRSATVLLIGGGLWALPFFLLAAVFGWDNVFVALAAFFSKMAVVTFGGAYAVLAYVAQQAVETFGWLRPGEMLDGLAMAETTPGPLILVLTYVGFLAAFREPFGLDPLTGGLLGAVVATWVTYVPCFLWIFLGAPYVEKLHGNRAVAGALSAITAAVVGVILNLAVWFALHVLFRQVDRIEVGVLSLVWPDVGTIDPAAAALSLVAIAMIFWLRQGVVTTLAVCAGLGLLIRLL